MKEQNPVKRNEQTTSANDKSNETTGGLNAPAYNVSAGDGPLAGMSESFGADFSNVNIHTDAAAAQKTETMGAKAATIGNDIFFNNGEYDPESLEGQKLLGHELTHVVQQRNGVVKPTAQLKGQDVNQSTGLEKEADEVGEHVARGGSAKNKISSNGGDSRSVSGSIAQFALTERKIGFYQEVGARLITGLMQQGVSQEKSYYVVAQVLQENGWSTDAPPGNNYFNIKGSNNGESITLTTHEEDSAGNRTMIQDEFRVYETLEESMADYLDLLRRLYPDAYDSLFNDEKTLSDFVTGLANGTRGRYATDADYSEQVTTLGRQVAREFGLAVPDFTAPELAQLPTEGQQSGDQGRPLTEYVQLSIIINSAMQGLGTDEQQVYSALSLLNRDSEKIAQLNGVYTERYGMSLESHIRSEFSNSMIFGNELDQALAYINVSGEAQEPVAEPEVEVQPVAETEPVVDGLARVDLQKNDRSAVQNRWVDDDGRTQYTDAFNNGIETQIVAFFGEGYTRERVMREIAEARAAGNTDLAEELRVKLFNANMYATVDAIDVENNPIHAPRDGKTYCNIYAYDVVTAMGGYLPHTWWNAEHERLAIEAHERGETYNPEEKLNYMTGTPESENNIREMNANALNAWLPRIGQPYFGWERAADMQAGQAAANAGNIVIISAARVGPGSGHINVILPETEQYTSAGEGEAFRPLQSQAGSSNFAHQPHRSQWWQNASHRDGAAWIYRGELASPIMTPEQMGGRAVEGPTQGDARATDTAAGGGEPLLDTTPVTRTIRQGMVTASELNIRPTAGTDQPRTGKIPRGTVVTVVAESNGWAQLEQGGWVSMDYLEMSDQEVGVNKRGGTITTPELNIRPNPNTDNPPVGTLTQGQTVNIVNEANGWYQIESGGWISGRFVQESQGDPVVEYDTEQMTTIANLVHSNPGDLQAAGSALNILGGNAQAIEAFKSVFQTTYGYSIETFIEGNFEDVDKALMLAQLYVTPVVTPEQEDPAELPDNGYDDNWPLAQEWTNGAGQTIQRKDNPDGDFGENRGTHIHAGIDLNMGGGHADLGAPVYATHSGRVEYVKDITEGNNGAGNQISIISHDGTYRTRYFHLQSRPDFSAGDEITEGMIIANVGGSGAGRTNRYTPHLHYEVHILVNGQWQKRDPMGRDGIIAPEEVR